MELSPQGGDGRRLGVEMCAALSGGADDSVIAARARHVAGMLRARGGARALEAALGAADLRPARYERKTARIPPRKEAEFVRAACDALSDQTFAAAAALAFRDFASIPGYVARFSRDLGAAIERASRLGALAGASTSYAAHEEGAAVALVMDCADAALLRNHRHQEFLLLLTLGQLRDVVGLDLRPLEVRFRHARSDPDGVARLVGCAARFAAPRTEILLPVGALALAIPTYDPNLRDYLIAHGEALLAARRGPGESLRNRVERQIIHSLPDRMPGAAETARALGMSARTFSRRLAAENVTYRGLAEAIRRDLARTYLNDDRLQVTEVAHLLGYADSAAFSNAFRRWEGVSPDRFRNRAAGS